MTRLSKSVAAFMALILATMFAQLAHAQADNFVDEASAKAIAEIETARLALEQSQNPEVRSFAQKMIDDHTRNRDELAQLAQQNNLEVSDDARLMDRAKAWILQWREGENFDEAYANNQVNAHQQTIDIYQDYIEEGQDENLRQYAEKSLPMLEEHLKQAEQLAQRFGGEQGQRSDRAQETRTQERGQERTQQNERNQQGLQQREEQQTERQRQDQIQREERQPQR